MNASSIAISRVPANAGSGPLTGFANFLVKEIAEWLRTRRFVALTLTATVLALSGVMIERFRQIAGDTAGPINLDPAYNLHMVGWDSLVPLFAAFGTMSLITAERDRGTLVWSLSMPLGRPAVFFAKLLAAIAFVGIAVVIVPELVSIGVIRLVYDGFPPHAQELFWEPLGGFAMAVFVIVLNLTVSMFVKGQMAVIGATLVSCLTIPPLATAISPDLSRWLPTDIFAFVTAYGEGSASHPETLAAWSLAMVGLVATALVRFGRREL